VGINIKEPGKNYQARLDVFRDTKDDLMGGCEYAFGSFEHEQLEEIQESWTPKEEVPEGLGFEERICSGPGQPQTFGNVTLPSIGFCVKTENLQACSRCRAVLCKFLCKQTPVPYNGCQLPNSPLTFSFFLNVCLRLWTRVPSSRLEARAQKRMR
jgi:hypothetical protein